jgi:conjugal transfer/type IV secretion protein DotA/TraY
MIISKKKILKTALLPGIIPRLKGLLGSGFGNLAYLIALVYNTVRILPNNHHFLKSDNIGTYSIRQVIVEASNHIHPSWKNIDQILMFFSVIAALIILVVQFLILMIAIAIPKARAQVDMPDTIAGFFVTPKPSEDIAYRLLDLVFGIPNLFGSKDFSENNVHSALHSLFEFYSFGMLLVGVLIIIYFVIAIVAETATSGVPFGQRFNKAWAPIRVILFFALLIPVSNGLNGGQYLTLNIAKLGSGLASTGWVTFQGQITETLTGSKKQNIAIPKPPNITHIPAFMLIAKTCERGYRLLFPFEDYEEAWNYNNDEGGIRAWVVYRQKSNLNADASHKAILLISTTTFQDISDLSGGPNFKIVFGVKDESTYADQNAAVSPICGSIALNITDIAEPGSAIIHTGYFNLIKDTWLSEGEIGPDLKDYAENFLKRASNMEGFKDLNATLPDLAYKNAWVSYIDRYMEGEKGVIPRAVKAQIDRGDWTLTGKMKDYGWAGAGIWYNKIAQQNGALVSALHQTPIIVKYPDIMERLREQALRENKGTAEDPMTDGVSADAPPLPYNLPGDEVMASVLIEVYKYWSGAEEQPGIHLTKNPIIDAINVMLGTGGLFEMCANADVHPLAQLSSVGKSMVDSAIRSYAAAGIFSIASIVPNPFSGAADAMAGFFGTVGSIGLLVGFILFYVVPFMPFLYFFFAVGGWVKGIFEAMVAMPLWALAHLRIDGDGIPGEAAIQGYFLLFEIFIRPILIVFGLLASITIFAAMVKILNDIFYLAISNLSGHNPETGTACFIDPDSNASTSGPSTETTLSKRGPVDEFFFTILYTIIVYLIATASFKLIDMIPNNILRWINAEVPSFNDNSGDAAEGLMRYISIGGSQFGTQISSSIGGVGKGLQSSAQQAKGFFGMG